MRFLPIKKLSVVAVGLILVIGVLSIPAIYAWQIKYNQLHTVPSLTQQFPVTVDPLHKLIVQDDQVDLLLAAPDSPLQAAAGSTSNTLSKIFVSIVSAIDRLSLYQSVALAGERVVTINPGLRKEQVASAFGSQLEWSSKQQKSFTLADAGAALPLVEGSFAPGTYVVDSDASPAEVQALVNQQFTKDVLSHYGTSTAQVVPLSTTLTVASLIERETLGPEDMRVVSGIIWNRIFANMDLQIDATLQYAKANVQKTGSWWPAVTPNDKFRASPYNTYLHPGLPPTPIANPSVAAILAALNPIKTSCLYYFNDKHGGFHCSDTYAQHVALLKQYYGQGK